MKRRQFLQGAGVGLAASALAAPALAQSMPELNWRLTSSFPKSLDIIYGGAELFAKALSDITDGKFKVQLFAAGEIVNAFQAADAVGDGTVELAHTCSYYYFGKDPTFAAGTALPFGLNARQQSAWYTQRGGNDLLNKLYHNYNLVGLPCGNTGTQMGGWFRKEFKSLDDFKGVKMRIAGLAGQVMSKLGVVPQQIAGGDIYSSLERGTIDGAEWVGPYDDEKLGFVKVAPYYYYPGWWEGGATLHLFVNKGKWDELPKIYQSAIRAAAAEADRDTLARYDASNPAALRSLIAAGAQLRPYTNEMLEAAFKAAKEVYAETGAQNALFKEVHDSIMEFKNEQYLWSQLAEFNFDRFQIANRGK